VVDLFEFGVIECVVVDLCFMYLLYFVWEVMFGCYWMLFDNLCWVDVSLWLL